MAIRKINAREFDSLGKRVPDGLWSVTGIIMAEAVDSISRGPRAGEVLPNPIINVMFRIDDDPRNGEWRGHQVRTTLVFHGTNHDMEMRALRMVTHLFQHGDPNVPAYVPVKGLPTEGEIPIDLVVEYDTQEIAKQLNERLGKGKGKRFTIDIVTPDPKDQAKNQVPAEAQQMQDPSQPQQPQAPARQRQFSGYNLRGVWAHKPPQTGVVSPSTELG